MKKVSKKKSKLEEKFKYLQIEEAIYLEKLPEKEVEEIRYIEIQIL